MHKQLTRTAIVIALISLTFPVVAAEESLESIEAQISAQWEKISSISAVMQLNAKMSRSFVGVTVKAKGPLLIQGGAEKQSCYRSELKGTATVRPFIFLHPKISMLIISDGEYKYTDQLIGDKRSVKRSAVQKQVESSPGGGAGYITALKEKYDCKALPSTTFQGREVFVIECRAKEGIDPPIEKFDHMLLYFDKETGFQIRTAMYAKKKKKPVTEMIFSELKMNPTIDPAQFIYTPPEGIEVVDADAVPEEAATAE